MDRATEIDANEGDRRMPPPSPARLAIRTVTKLALRRPRTPATPSRSWTEERNDLVMPFARRRSPDRTVVALFSALAFMVVGTTGRDACGADEARAVERYRDAIEPILADHCFSCHGNGSKKGNVDLDGFETDASILARRDLWLDVLKNVRAGLMPPSGKPRPSATELALLEDWIKRQAFDLDPADPDPGRVTLRRLNRVEYRNTIRDLMGIDFRADEEFPADDAGYGFDNIGDVLSVSPLLLEKYMQAAEAIVKQAVPTASRVVLTKTWEGREFRDPENDVKGDKLSVYQASKVARLLETTRKGEYRLSVDLSVRGNFDFDPGRGKLAISFGGRELAVDQFGWDDGKKVHHEWTESLEPGAHSLAFAMTPLVPIDQKKNYVDVRIVGVKLEGPLDPSEWVRPPRFERFFARSDPGDHAARTVEAREVLTRFVTKAYRRPVDRRTVDRLVAIAEAGFAQPGLSFEASVGRAMVAVLASPRFLFRVEGSTAGGASKVAAPVDEFALASRLSYFLWSTMPDEELNGLASRGELRKNLPAQVKRMLGDAKVDEFYRNFPGQWLQARDYEHFPIQVATILRRDGLPFKKDDDKGSVRRAMRLEAEAFFAHVLREDRPILDFIDSDYAMLNEDLAKHYGIPGVTGREFRRVALPEGSPRGGLLTQAGVLMITSNPSRTSPVKRGQFLLENILGTPTPPPPPDIPSLEETIRNFGKTPTMREVMEVHRKDPLCASCHNRMDPLGLAFENYNALGIFREKERDHPIDASGTLVTGRSFRNAVELKAILKSEYRLDFYRCLTEKMLTYALGRGPDYYDVETIDAIVDRLGREDGKFSALLMGVIESAPFQKRRSAPAMASAADSRTDPNPPKGHPHAPSDPAASNPGAQR